MEASSLRSMEDVKEASVEGMGASVEASMETLNGGEGGCKKRPRRGAAAA